MGDLPPLSNNEYADREAVITGAWRVEDLGKKKLVATPPEDHTYWHYMRRLAWNAASWQRKIERIITKALTHLTVIVGYQLLHHFWPNVFPDVVGELVKHGGR